MVENNVLKKIARAEVGTASKVTDPVHESGKVSLKVSSKKSKKKSRKQIEAAKEAQDLQEMASGNSLKRKNPNGGGTQPSSEKTKV